MQRKSSGSTAQEEGSSFLKQRLPQEENPHFVIIFEIIFLYKKFSKFSIKKKLRQSTINFGIDTWLVFVYTARI